MYLEAKECEAIGRTEQALGLYRRMLKKSPVSAHDIVEALWGLIM